MMYSIHEIIPNKEYKCSLMIQDGYERWTSKTLEEAYSEMIEGAKIMNGTTIKPADIMFFDSQFSDKGKT